MSVINKYLGETLVDVATHPVYSKYTVVDWAMLFVAKYGQTDGDHHKAWVLDQVARILNGTPVIVKLAKWDNDLEEYRFDVNTPSQKYLDWVEKMLGKKEKDGSREYSYEEGIAP